MSSSRESILAKIAAASAPVAARRALPDYQDDALLAHPRLGDGTLWEIFARNFEAVAGRALVGEAALTELLRAQQLRHGYCDPALLDRLGPALAAAGVVVETTFERARYDDYEFGITVASGAIAESGTLIIDDLRTSDRLAALSPWLHVAVLSEAEIIRSIPEAIARFDKAPNIIWITGPSKTADVEGILIQGVHGPGEQVALLLG
jgi:L-lactate dehydrogenase complex protein LldG